MLNSDDQTFQQGMQRVEGLIRSIETIADPAVRSSVEELLGALMNLHGAAIERMLEIVDGAGEPGAAIIDQLGADESVGSMLLLYGLHPLSLEARVHRALEQVRPYLNSHGGGVELLDVAPGGVVRLRLQGSCNGCPSSEMTLKLAIEEAIYGAAPDIGELEVEGVVARRAMASNGVIPLELIGHNGAPQTQSGGWQQVDGLGAIESGMAQTLEVSGKAVLFCRVGDSLYAYGATCPACHKPLGAAHVNATSLTCGKCGQHYDVLRAGRGLDQPGLHLEPFPLLVEQGQARIAMPV